jgi:hypothetical protein
MTANRTPVRRFVKLALGLALLAALPTVLGGCGCRCTGLIRSDSSRSLAYLMDAEGARFCDAKDKMANAPSIVAGGLSRDAKAGMANLCATAEVYGGCHGHVAETPAAK